MIVDNDYSLLDKYNACETKKSNAQVEGKYYEYVHIDDIK